MWLDVVRYADTGGYHSDNHRDVCAVPRLGHQLLQSRTSRSTDSRLNSSPAICCRTRPADAKIASGYNRLLHNDGGRAARRRRSTPAKYAADRVRNTSNVWLGADARLRRVPQPQIRSVHDAGFLPLRRLLRRRQGESGRPARADADHDGGAGSRIEESSRPASPNWRRNWPSHRPSSMTPRRNGKSQSQRRKTARRACPKPVADALKASPDKRTAGTEASDRRPLSLTLAAENEPLRKKLSALRARKDQLLKAIPTTLVSMTGPPRTMRVLPRGNWLDDSGEVVDPAVPAVLGTVAPASSERRATRLELASGLPLPRTR